jgi:hypothetical protein
MKPTIAASKPNKATLAIARPDDFDEVLVEDAQAPIQELLQRT